MDYFWDDSGLETTDEAEAESKREERRRAEEAEADKKRKDDDFKPGSDMHTWATTRFF